MTFRKSQDSTPYFNSRPCERGDDQIIFHFFFPFISIPAPARGATSAVSGYRLLYSFQFPPLREGRPLDCIVFFLQSSISIPAPARGATWVETTPHGGAANFNSRPCERGDGGLLFFFLGGVISIPAPARGATDQNCRLRRMVEISIPAPARGATRLPSCPAK